MTSPEEAWIATARARLVEAKYRLDESIEAINNSNTTRQTWPMTGKISNMISEIEELLVELMEMKKSGQR